MLSPRLLSILRDYRLLVGGRHGDGDRQGNDGSEPRHEGRHARLSGCSRLKWLTIHCGMLEIQNGSLTIRTA